MCDSISCSSLVFGPGNVGAFRKLSRAGACPLPLLFRLSLLLLFCMIGGHLDAQLAPQERKQCVRVPEALGVVAARHFQGSAPRRLLLTSAISPQSLRTDQRSTRTTEVVLQQAEVLGADRRIAVKVGPVVVPGISCAFAKGVLHDGEVLS